MPWCPNCKTEYKKGVTVCADCGTELVESLEEASLIKIMEVDNEEVANKLADFFEYEGLKNVTLREGEENKVEILVPDIQKKEAVKLAKAFLTVQAEKEIEIKNEIAQSADDTVETKTSKETSTIYVKKEDRYKDNLSSAYTFLIFGIVGIIFVIINGMGYLSFLSGWFSLGVATALFFLFIIIGVYSFRQAGSLKKEAEKENTLTGQIEEWMKNTVTREFFMQVDDPDVSEEGNVIARMEFVKEKLKEQFPQINESYADQLVEEFYDKVM